MYAFLTNYYYMPRDVNFRLVGLEKLPSDKHRLYIVTIGQNIYYIIINKL